MIWRQGPAPRVELVFDEASTYIACCRTEAHAAWVCNILDRESCKLTTESNSPLFETDLASLIEKHFEDVLRQLEQQQQAEDKEEPDEDIDA